MIEKTRISFFAAAFLGALFVTSCSPKDSTTIAQSNMTYDDDYESEAQEWVGPGYYYGIYYGDEAAYRAWVERSWRRGYYRNGRRYDRRQYRRGAGEIFRDEVDRGVDEVDRGVGEVKRGIRGR